MTIPNPTQTNTRAWPHHVFKPEILKSPGKSTISAMLAIGLATVWMGLVSGLIEVVIHFGRHELTAASLGSLQMNRHFLWMIPVTNLAIFSASMLPLLFLAIVRPDSARRGSRYLLIFLTSLDLLLIVRGIHWGATLVLALGMAYQGVPILERRVTRARRFLVFSLPAVIGIVGFLGYVSYDRMVLEENRLIAALPAAAPDAPNVLLVVIDTMRADRLSDSSSPRQTTPNLEALARRGVSFQEARSAAPWTFPSHANIFTGRWPHELNIGGERGLDGTYPTLAEFLSAKGYSTSGFVANTYFCNSWFGLGRGFAHYEDYYDQNVAVSISEAARCSALGRRILELLGGKESIRAGDTAPQKTAEQINGHFLNWVAGHKGRPFFAFLNYIDPHDPYLPPEEFEKPFGPDANTPQEIELLRSWHTSNLQNLTKGELEMAINGYDDCVAYVDEQLGKLFDELETKGILDNTLVIITGDHGEAFGEHRQYLHGKSLYREETHVPLIMFGPTEVPSDRKITEPVSLRDLASTIVDRLGYKTDSPFPGRSIARFWETKGSEVSEPEEPILSEIEIVQKVSKNPNRPPAYRGPMASMILDGHVYIRDAIGREELFDLKNDPGEKTNLVDDAARFPLLKHCRETYDRVVPESHDRSRKERNKGVSQAIRCRETPLGFGSEHYFA